jgi:hypothetical protein
MCRYSCSYGTGIKPKAENIFESVADPGSGAFLPLDPESGMEKNQEPGSGMDIPHLLFIFGLKIFKFFDADPGSCQPGSGMEKIGFGINEFLGLKKMQYLIKKQKIFVVKFYTFYSNVLHCYTYFLLFFAVIVISFPFLALQGVPFHYYANIQRQQ